MKKKLNHFLPGFLIGLLIGPLIGFYIYYLMQFNHMSFKNFLTLLKNTPSIQSPVLSLCLIFNAFAFFGILRINMERMARGIVIGTLLYFPVMIYLKFIR